MLISVNFYCQNYFGWNKGAITLFNTQLINYLVSSNYRNTNILFLNGDCYFNIFLTFGPSCVTTNIHCCITVFPRKFMFKYAVSFCLYEVRYYLSRISSKVNSYCIYKYRHVLRIKLYSYLLKLVLCIKCWLNETNQTQLTRYNVYDIKVMSAFCSVCFIKL